MNNTELKGNWNVLKGKLMQKYGELTKDDLAFTEGQEDEIWGLIQKKVGKTKAEIQEEIAKF